MILRYCFVKLAHAILVASIYRNIENMRTYLLILLLLPNLVFAVTIPTQYKLPTSVVFTYTPIMINQSCKLINKHLSKLNKPHYFTLNINYPYLNCKDNLILSKTFNRTIHKAVNHEIKDFKNNLQSPKALRQHHIPGMPLNTRSNTFYINYQVLFYNKNIISLRFSNNTYYFLSAHPNSYFTTINYNAAQNKVISWKKLFSNSKDLKVIAQYSRDQLAKILIGNKAKQGLKTNAITLEMIRFGTKAKLENFKVWNIVTEGILMNFQPYQVAAYVQGPQFVLLPWSLLPDNNNYLHNVS